MMVRIITGPLAGKTLDLPASEVLQLLNDGTAEIDVESPPPESAAIDPRREKAVVPAAKPNPV